MKVTFTLPSKKTFDAFVGGRIGEGRGTYLHEGRKLAGEASVVETLVVKRAKPGCERLFDIARSACERLDHPSLVRYLGAGTSDEGPVVAFERAGENALVLFNGPGRRCKYRDPGTYYYPLPPGRALELAFDLLLALEYLHTREFVHGSVRPSALLVRVPGAAHDAKDVLTNVAEGAFEGVLGALGSVRAKKFCEDLSHGLVEPTLAPTLHPVFSPPEVLLDGAGTRGPAMDVYGFGLVFHMLLTGRHPYDAYVEPGQLNDVERIFALKGAEARGEISPVHLDALDDIPLHDVAFEGFAPVVWCQFRTAAAHIIRATTEPAPGARMDSTSVRTFFENELGLRPSGSSAPRPWSARTIQMRPLANRLVGDKPSNGLAIREEEGELIIEERRARIPQRNQGPVFPVGEGSIVQFRTADRANSTMVGAGKRGLFPEAPSGGLYLGDVLREFKGKRPLPVSYPVLVTRTTFSRTDLVRCLVFSLGRASTRLHLSSDGAVDTKVRVVVGRDDTVDVPVPDTSVSKRHLAIERRNGFWWVEDLKSTNGTVVDGFRVPKGGRLRIRGRMATIEVGPDSRLTYMEQPEFEVFLESALAAWSQIFGKDARPAGPAPPPAPLPPNVDGIALLDQVPATQGEAWGTGVMRIEQPTTKMKRDFLKQRLDDMLRKKGSAVPSSSAPSGNEVPTAMPPDIEERLKWHDSTGASIRLIFLGSRVDEVEGVEDALRVVRDQPQDLIGIEVLPQGGDRIVLFRRPTADDSEEGAPLPP